MSQIASPTTMLATYTVGEEALGAVQGLLRRLVAEADSAGSSRVSVDATPVESGPDGRRLYRLRIEASSVPQIGGFELVGKVLHNTAGPNLVHDFAGAGLVERFLEAPANCAHCGRARRRVETYLLRGVDGEVRQVGRTCLRDYAVGSKAAAKAALGAADLLAEVSGALRQWDEAEPINSQLTLPTYLELAAEALMRRGWVSTGKSRNTGEPSTADQALRLLAEPRMTVLRPAARGLAQQALCWVRSLPKQDHEYLESLRRVCRTDIVERRDVGLAASVLWAYRSRHHLKVALPGDGEMPGAIPRWDADEYQRLVGALNPPIEAADLLRFARDLSTDIQASAGNLVEIELAVDRLPDGEHREAEVQAAGDILWHLASYLSVRGIPLSEVLEESLGRIARSGEARRTA